MLAQDYEERYNSMKSVKLVNNDGNVWIGYEGPLTCHAS